MQAHSLKSLATYLILIASAVGTLANPAAAQSDKTSFDMVVSAAAALR